MNEPDIKFCEHNATYKSCLMKIVKKFYVMIFQNLIAENKTIKLQFLSNNL